MFVVRWFVALVSPRLALAPAVVLVLALASVTGGCAIAPPDDTIDVVFDPCQLLTLAPDDGTTAPESDAVDAAIVLWNDRAHAQLTTDAAAGVPVLPVRFEPAALAFRGLYDDENGILFVNGKLTDPTAQAITVAHELGHAFGLPHVDRGQRASVMNPGNVAVEPTAEDAAALAVRWGTCETL